MVRSHLLYYGELYQAERGFCKHFLSEAITHFTYHREREREISLTLEHVNNHFRISFHLSGTCK